MIITDKLRGVRDWFERLSSRERSLISGLAVTFVLMVTLIVGYFVSDGLSTLAERNEDMRQALRDLDTKRDAYLKSKAKMSQLETRLGGTIQLGGYLEQAAKEAGVEIIESNDRQPVTVGKWTEKSRDVHLSRVKLEALAAFLKRIETGPQLVVVSGLLVRTRDDKHQELEVDLTATTYEHAAKDKGGAKRGEKEKG